MPERDDGSTALRLMLNYRMPHHHSDFPMIWFWSHKSGCTSLIRWFFYQTGLLEKALRYHPWVHQYENDIFKRNANYVTALTSDLQAAQKDVYKLVRDPYKRAVSAFVMLYYQHEPYWREQWKRIRMHLYSDPNSTKGLAFKQYLMYLKDTGVQLGQTDVHFSEQYVEGEEQFHPHIVQLEQFDKRIGELEKHYGLQASRRSEISDSPHHSSSLMSISGKYWDADIADPTFPRFPTVDSFYNRETLLLVETIYSNDFERYGYRKKSKKRFFLS